MNAREGMVLQKKHRNHKTWGRFSSIALLVLASAACHPGTPARDAAGKSSSSEKPKSTSEDPFEQARKALVGGKWDRAEELLHRAERRDRARAHLELAQLFLKTGRLEEVPVILRGHTGAAPDFLRARALRGQGALTEALSFLEKPRKDLMDVLRQAELRGEILLELGKRDEADMAFFLLVEQANQGAFDALPVVPRAEAWGLVGRAAHYLRSPEDANDAFNQSETLHDADVPLLLARAHLFLEKFDFAHASEVIDDALKLAPHDPDVLVAKAHLELESSLAFLEVEELCRRALSINPHHTGAYFLRAGIHLRDLSLTEAAAQVERGLTVNPRDLPLLSMKAAILFLSEKPAAFEKQVEEVLRLSPGYAEIFRIIGHHAEWEHRYPDIEKLMRRAIRIDREDGRARALLGLTLVRSSSESAGVVELRRAFELDPFNVRVLNTLDLYEKIIPTEYVEKNHGPFALRFPKTEADLLERYVPALLDQAYAQMKERYAYEPEAPIGIEIYQSREQFSVRTSGLPRVAIQGVCFGRKLATMSPLGSPGNLGMTLWHELGHVFHIGLSQNRVPRWLTEGLAEWETAQRKVGWSRELDLDLLRALERDALPHLDSMSRAFTHARRFEDVATAYYASGQIAQFIVESRGQTAAQKLLAEFGKKRLPKEVVPEVLGASFDELDAQFRNWARGELQHFQGQFVSWDPGAPAEELLPLAKKNPDDIELQVRLGVALLMEGSAEQADAVLGRVLAQTFHPQAAFFRARLLLAHEKKDEARALLDELVQQGHDGVEVRLLLARLFIAASDFESAEEHVKKAAAKDPRSEEAASLLAALALKRGDKEGEIEALRRWASLSEHDPIPHRRLMQTLVEAGRAREAVAASELAVWVDLAGLETHRLAGLVQARSGNLKRAEFEWESALLCPATPADLARLAETWKEELRRVGQGARAARIDERVAEEARLAVPLGAPGGAPLAP